MPPPAKPEQTVRQQGLAETLRHAREAEGGVEVTQRQGKEGLKMGIEDMCNAGSSPVLRTLIFRASFASRNPPMNLLTADLCCG